MKRYREKQQRTSADIIIMISDEEEYFRKKFITEKPDSNEWKCTICATITTATPYPHPVLRVSICFTCLNSYENAVFLTNKDGTDKMCRWCAKQAKKYNCTECTVVFCKDCIERNFNTEYIRSRVMLNNCDWNCFVCYPKPLWRLRVACIQAIENSKRFSTNGEVSMEEIGTIDLFSQDSQEDRMPVSQQALLNSESHNEQFNSELEEVISPKKAPKPIIDFDNDNDSLCKTQVHTNDVSISIEQEMTTEETASFSVVLQEAEKDFQNFAGLFSKRITEFSQKCQKVNSYEQAKKIANKVSLFCDKAIANFQFIKQNNEVRFQVWNNSVNKPQKPAHKDDVIQSENVCDNKTLTKSKSPQKNKNKSLVKTEPVTNLPSTSKLVKNKNTAKRKFSLSLKTSPNGPDNTSCTSPKEPENSTSTPLKEPENNTSTPLKEPENNTSTPSKEPKNKRSTSPKEPENNVSSIDSEDTLAFIERIKHKIPDDEISPKRNLMFPSSIIREIPEDKKKQSTISKPEDNIEESLTPIKPKYPKQQQTRNKNSKSATENESKKKTEDMNNDFLTPIKRKYPKNIKSSNASPISSSQNKSETQSSTNLNNLLKSEICSSNSSLQSLQIKPEADILEDDTGSIFSNATVIREELPAEQVTIKKEQNMDDFDKQAISGAEELKARIQEDFEVFSHASNITVQIENYLCEKTGDFCQSYRTGNDSIDDDSFSENTEHIFGLSDDNDSNKTEDYDWNSMDLTEDIDKISDQKEDDNNFKTAEQENDDFLRETRTIKEEQNTEEEKVSLENQSQEFYFNFITNEQNKTTTNEKDKNIQDSDAETVISDSEYDREAAFQALIRDFSETEVSSLDSDDSDITEKFSPEYKVMYESGHVRQLDIAAEIAKLWGNNQENLSDEDESDNEVEGDQSNSSATEDEKNEVLFCDSDNDSVQDPKLNMKPVVLLNNDIRLSLKPVVELERLNLEKHLTEFKSRINNSPSNNNDDSEEEIRRLIDLNSLNKRTILPSSDSDTDNSELRVNRKKKKLKKSSKIYSSSFSSVDCDSDESFKSIKSEPESDDFHFNYEQKDKNYMPKISEDLLNDTLTEGTISDDDDVLEIKEDKKEKKNQDNDNDEILITDEDEPEKIMENDGKSKWRKDKLLTNSLALSNTDTDTTNDSTANEIMQKKEDRYLKNADKEKPVRKTTVISSSDEEDNAIILSTDGEDKTDSDDSDIQFIGLKRKRESDEDGPSTSNKKGRRNIREVLKDNELQEETKKADKLEFERKERLSLKQKTLDTLLSESQLSQEEVGLVLDVDQDKKEPLVTVHHTLIPRLKEHQKNGIKFMWDGCFESVEELNRSKGAGCILAHCMGLGKTMQVVVLAHTLLTHPKTNVKHILVVCPLSTVFNWRNEFIQTLKVCQKKIQLFDIRPDRQKTFDSKMFEVKRWKSDGGVLMLGYESFQSLVNDEKLNKTEESYKQIMLESLIDPGPDLVVCDEGHMLKNGKTLRFTSLSKIKTLRRIILTGTPLQNNLIEYYHMVNFVKPHLLGTLEEYKNRFVNPIVNGQYEDSNREDINLMKKRSHILHKKLETTVQRYEESELAPYLPEKLDYVLYTQLTPLQIKLYEHYLQLLDVNTKKLFKNYHALQNIWTHPALLKIKYDKRKEPAPKKKQKRYDEDFVPALDPDSEDSTGLETDWFKDLLPEDILTNISYGVKMEILFSVIKECEAVNDKLLVFSSSIDELDLIEFFLKQRVGESWIKGTDYYRMDGTVAPEKRMKYCNDFNNEKNQRSRVFLVSHKVGGLGLNLTAASRVVLMDVSWNPAYDIQSVFRVYRFGQTKTCYIYRFVSMGTMEEVVYSRAVTKLAISCRVVDEHQIKRHFNSDDLQRMYRLIKDFGESPTLALPSDRLLAKLWETHKPLLYKFCDHQSLLENLSHEELNDEEMKVAWEEFRSEVERENQNKEMANNRFNYQQIPDQGSNMPYLLLPKYQLPPIVPMKTYQLPDNARYKRPNQLLSQQDMINRAYYNLQKFSLLNSGGPSTSTNIPNLNSTSANIPASTTRISSSFPAVSTSINPVFSAPSTSASLAVTNDNQPMNLSTNSVGGYKNVSNIPKPGTLTRQVSNLIPNNEKANTKTPVTIQVPSSQICKNPFSGKVGATNGFTTIRKNGNNTYVNRISDSNVPTGIVKYTPSGQKENIIQDMERSIQHLSKNGVSISSKNNDAQQNLTPLPLAPNYLTK